MALTTSQLNQALAVSHNYINDEIPNLYIQANPLHDMMLKKAKFVSGGNAIQLPIRDTKVQSLGYISGTEADTLNTNTNRQITYGELDWKFFYAALTVTLEEYVKTHDSAEAIISLIELKTQNLADSIVDEFAADFYESGTSSNKQFNGLADIFAASGTAYAGILDTDVTSWLTSIDSTSTDVDYTTLNPKLIYLKSLKSKVDWILSNDAVLSAYMNNEKLIQRYDTTQLDSGFTVAKINNVNWYADRNCQGTGAGTADNYLYMIDSSTLMLFYKYGFKGKKAPLDVQNIPSANQPINTSISFMAGNMGCTNRRKNGVFKTLNPPA
jgi:hypothetical protein